MANETEQLAWVVLRTVNRTQAKGSTVRVVVPRDPEVVYELGPVPIEDELLSAEEYLLDRGYVAPVNIGLTRGTYTITPAGMDWLDRGFPVVPEPSETAQTVEEEPERTEQPRPAQRGSEGPREPWWRRMFGD